MKKTEWLIVFLPLVFTLLIDQITKQWANGLTEIINWGYFGFVLHHNPGAMLGLFSDLPPVLRVVTLSTGGAILVCVYALIQYLLPIKSMKLRTGLSFLLGGILGNVADRIFYGYVIDFIVIGNVSFSSPAFNLGDALQWVGYALIMWAFVVEGDILWPENDARKKYWININFQLKYSFFLFGVGVGVGLIALVFSYTYLRVTMIDLIGQNQFVLDKFLEPFAITFALLTLGFSVALFSIGKVISHKIAGPLYAFEKYLNDLMGGSNRQFKLRTKDEFKHLELLGEKIKQHLIHHKALQASENAAPVSAEEQEILGAIQVELAEQELKKTTS
jgi:signal peptidase II